MRYYGEVQQEVRGIFRGRGDFSMFVVQTYIVVVTINQF